jgi:hypothetical protein
VKEVETEVVPSAGRTAVTVEAVASSDAETVYVDVTFALIRFPVPCSQSS